MINFVVAVAVAFLAFGGDRTAAHDDAPLSCYVCDDCPEPFQLDSSFLVSCAADDVVTSPLTTPPPTATQNATTVSVGSAITGNTTVPSPFSPGATTTVGATAPSPTVNIQSTTPVAVTVPPSAPLIPNDVATNPVINATTTTHTMPPTAPSIATIAQVDTAITGSTTVPSPFSPGATNVTFPAAPLTTNAPNASAFGGPQIDDISDDADLQFVTSVVNGSNMVDSPSLAYNGSTIVAPTIVYPIVLPAEVATNNVSSLPLVSENATTTASDLLGLAVVSNGTALNLNGSLAIPANRTAFVPLGALRGRRSVRHLEPTHHCYVIKHKDVLSGAIKVHRGCVRHNATNALMCERAAANLTTQHQPDECRICERDGCNSAPPSRSIALLVGIGALVAVIFAAWQ